MDKYLQFCDIYKQLLNFASENDFKNEETIKWIVVKVLRIMRKEFDNIKQVTPDDFSRMLSSLERYIKGESLSKIFGFIEFYGNYFNVTENVFDPRISTESLINEILRNCSKENKYKILDLCCGSGAIGITLSNLLNSDVLGVDISPFCIDISKQNAKNLKSNASFMQMDILDDWSKYLREKYDIIVSNPPYWNSQKILLNKEITNGNPICAFDGGDDGLKYIRAIIEKSPQFLSQNGKIFLEIDPEQECIVKDLLNQNFINIGIGYDYKKIKRVIFAQLK